MFEKVHSFSFRENLIEEMADLDNQVFLVPLTIHEKIWLKSLLQSKDAPFFLRQETLQKLEEVLHDISSINDQPIIEKFRINGDQVDHDHQIINVYRMLRQLIMEKKGFRLTYRTNDGACHESINGIPFRLEYLIHKKQWTVIWILLEDGKVGEELIYTPLQKIQSIALFDLDDGVFESACEGFEKIIKGEKLTAKLLINQKAFQKHSFMEEKQRILYTLSGFEKELFYDETINQYEIQLFYRPTEAENLLQKIRLLGRKIIIKEPDSLRDRMLKTAQGALQRYS